MLWGKYPLLSIIIILTVFFGATLPRVSSAQSSLIEPYCDSFNDNWFSTIAFSYDYCVVPDFVGEAVTVNGVNFNAYLSVEIISDKDEMDGLISQDFQGGNLRLGETRTGEFDFEEFKTINIGDYATIKKMVFKTRYFDENGEVILAKGYKTTVDILIRARVGSCLATLESDGERGGTTDASYANSVFSLTEAKAREIEAKMASISECGTPAAITPVSDKPAAEPEPEPTQISTTEKPPEEIPEPIRDVAENPPTQEIPPGEEEPDIEPAGEVIKDGAGGQADGETAVTPDQPCPDKETIETWRQALADADRALEKALNIADKLRDDLSRNGFKIQSAKDLIESLKKQLRDLIPELEHTRSGLQAQLERAEKRLSDLEDNRKKLLPKAEEAEQAYREAQDKHINTQTVYEVGQIKYEDCVARKEIEVIVENFEQQSRDFEATLIREREEFEQRCEKAKHEEARNDFFERQQDGLVPQDVWAPRYTDSPAPECSRGDIREEEHICRYISVDDTRNIMFSHSGNAIPEDSMDGLRDLFDALGTFSGTIGLKVIPTPDITFFGTTEFIDPILAAISAIPDILDMIFGGVVFLRVEEYTFTKTYTCEADGECWKVDWEIDTDCYKEEWKDRVEFECMELERFSRDPEEILSVSFRDAGGGLCRLPKDREDLADFFLDLGQKALKHAWWVNEFPDNDSACPEDPPDCPKKYRH